MAERISLTTREASEFLGVPVGTLKAWRHRGQGPPFHQPRGKHTTPLYDLEALEIFKIARKN